MNDRLRVVLENKFFPVQAFFNIILDRDFISTLSAFAKGVGGGFNDAFCSFPGEEEFDEEVINGIEFALYEEVIIISYSDFFSILNDVCDIYLKTNKEQTDEVEILLREIETALSNYPKAKVGAENNSAVPCLLPPR